MSSTRLRKLKKGFILNAYKESFLIRQRMKYFLQVNDLYKVEEQKFELMIICWRKLRFNWVYGVSWKKEKNGSRYNLNC